MQRADLPMMTPRLARALLVLTVFTLLGLLSAADEYIVPMLAPPVPAAEAPRGERRAAPPGAHSPSDGRSAFPVAAPAEHKIQPEYILARFRLYLAWAIVTPGILWLGRKVPLRRRPWVLAVTFHAVVPVAGSLPFFCLRTLVNSALGAEFPTWTVITNIPWARVFVLQAVGTVPFYWLLLGAGTVVQLSREYAANQLRAIDLQRSLADAQLDALKMKLQPHFLFNTLNGISAMARTGDTDAVIRTVERLGTLLRLSMDTSARPFVPLADELALADAYLAIEEIRFGDRLRVVRRIAPEAHQALVPSLILQPLIENALVHGLSRRLDASLLEIAARRDGADLRIAVRDDGPGLPSGWSLASGAGVGLTNVGDRMRGLYPGSDRFRVENGVTGGAVAVLSLPFVETVTEPAGSDGHGERQDNHR